MSDRNFDAMRKLIEEAGAKALKLTGDANDRAEEIMATIERRFGPRGVIAVKASISLLRGVATSAGLAAPLLPKEIADMMLSELLRAHAKATASLCTLALEDDSEELATLVGPLLSHEYQTAKDLLSVQIDASNAATKLMRGD